MAASGVLMSTSSTFSDDLYGVPLFKDEKEQFNTFESSTISVPFDGKTLTFGDKQYCTLPKSGEVIKNITLKTTLGPLFNPLSTSYVYPTLSSQVDTNIYNQSQTIIGSGKGTVEFYNTQTLKIWFQSYGLSVTFDGTRFNFSSAPSFKSEQSASFWGFDISICDSQTVVGGITYYNFKTLSSPLTIIQSGWTLGYTPVQPGRGYVDSVGLKVVKNATLLYGNQIIQTLTSQVLVTEHDIQIPYENQAALTILVGKNDVSVPTTNRVYYTKLNFDPVPVLSMYHSTTRLQVQFEEATNLVNIPITQGVNDTNAYIDSGIQNIQVNPGTNVGFDCHYFNNLIFTRYQAPVSGLGSNSSANYSQWYITDVANKKYYYWNGGYLPPAAVTRPYIDSVMSDVDIATPYNALYQFGAQFLYSVNVDQILNSANTLIQGYIYQSNLLPNKSYDFMTALYPSGTKNILAILAQGIYIYMLCQMNSDIYWVSYDRTLDISLQSSFTQILPGYKSFYPSYNGTPNFAGVMSNGSDIFIKLGGNSNLIHCIIVSNTVTWSNGPLNSTGPSTLTHCEFDGINIYTQPDSTNTFYRFDGTTYTSYINTLVPYGYTYNVVGFDGSYVYYASYGSTYTSNILVFYNTQNNFTDPTAWGYKNFAGFLKPKVLPSPYGNYLVTHSSNILVFNPLPVVPTIYSVAVLEYINYEEMHPDTFETLVTQNEQNTFTIQAKQISGQFILNFKGPIREFWISCAIPLSRMVLSIEGEILADEDYTSLYALRPYETHTTMPTYPVAFYPIALKPEQYTPSGVLNIARMGYPIITFYLQSVQSTDTQIVITARSYNVLSVDGGIGALKYN
jgi:hypothetical protein